MFKFKKLTISLVLILFIFLFISQSYALDNETINTLDIEDSLGDASTTEIYVNASNEENGTGEKLNPYKNLETVKMEAGHTVHIADGEYTYKSFNSLNNITLIGEHTDKTIIKCNNLEITANNLILRNLTIIGATFKNQGNFTAQNTIFKNSKGKVIDEYRNSYGGCIYTSYRSNDNEKHLISLTDCYFINNSAEYGGAIYIDKGDLDITRCYFLNNTAYNYGGAIAISYADKVTIKKSRFDNDNSKDDAGGAIYSMCSTLTVNDVNITNCSSTFGAGITALNTKLDIDNLNAYNNIAKYNGGAIYQMYSTSLITSSNFINNSATNGGALFLDNITSLFLNNNQFINNSAKACGGAIYSLLNKEYSNINNTYKNNSAIENNDTYTTSTINNIILSSNHTTIHYTPQNDIVLGDYYNLVEHGYVSPVKDQQDSGNCWSFSVIAALESCILKAINKTYDLSEENMKNIMASFSDYGWKVDVNNGGYDDMAIGYLVGWLGPINDSDDKFDDSGALSPVLNQLFQIQNVVYIKRNNYLDNDGIKEAILKYGAVSTGIYYSGLYLNDYNYYYYDNIMPSNHAVTIVGWDDNYSRYNFGNINTPAGDGAFIVKNSWGTDWGKDGYFYVSYYDRKFAQVGENEVSYTFILNDTIKYDKNYQYDVAGKTDYLITGEKTLWYQNIFNATDNEYLAAVSTYFTESTDWEVSIFVNNIFKTSTSGTSKPGYYTINLGDLIHLNKGDEFRVVFKITAEEHAKIPILEEQYINKVPFGYGISFFSKDGENWTDLYKFEFSDFNRRCISQVACIKAFTIFDTLNSTIKLDISDRGIDSINIKAIVCDPYNQLINSGNVTFTIDGIEYTVNVVNGIAQLNHRLKNNTDSIIYAIFNNENYYPSSNSTEIKFYTSNIKLDIKDVKYGQLILANITLIDNEGNELSDDINLTVANETYLVHIEGNKLFYVPKILDIGSYNATLKYKDNIIKQNEFKILKNNVSMNVLLKEEKNNLTINIQFSEPINELVNITISGKQYTVETVNGRASLFLDDLDYGTHEIVVSFVDNNYENIYKNYTIQTTVYKSKIIQDKIEYTQEGIVYSVNLTKLDNSPIIGKELTFIINNKEYKNTTNQNGTAFVLFELTNGNYPIKVTFEGYDNIIGYSLNNNLIIDRPIVKIQDVNVPKEIGVYENNYINLTFSDTANGNLIILIDNKEYLNNHFTSNYFEVPLNDLKIGKHEIIINYTGVEGYKYYNSFNISIVKSNPKIDILYDKCYTNYETVFTFNLPTYATGYIFVDIEGKHYYSKIINGKADIIIDGLSEGNKDLFYYYDSDENYNALNGNINFEVINKFKLNSNENITMLYTDGSTYKVKLLNSDDSIVENATVVIKIDGKSYNVKTDKNGWASLKITLKPKTYTISASYDNVKVSNKVIVKSILKSTNYTIKKSAKKLTVKATLSKVKGKYLKSKKVTFKFNGKTYTAKTNSKGVAQLTISKNMIKKLKINKKYSMQISYLKDTIKKVVLVKK